MASSVVRSDTDDGMYLYLCALWDAGIGHTAFLDSWSVVAISKYFCRKQSMGNKFSADDLDAWTPKTRRPGRSEPSPKPQTQEYKMMRDKIKLNVLHLTREPSKHRRLQYMDALCHVLQHRQQLMTLSLGNW